MGDTSILIVKWNHKGMEEGMRNTMYHVYIWSGIMLFEGATKLKCILETPGKLLKLFFKRSMVGMLREEISRTI